MATKTNSFVIPGLIKRRRDIQAKADYLTRQLDSLSADLESLDKAIKVIDPDFDLSTIRPKQYIDPNRKLIPYQSEVMQMLGSRENLLTVAEICDELVKNGHPCNSVSDRARLRDKIKNYLRRKIRRGWVVKEGSRYRLCDSMLELGQFQE